MHYVCFYTYLTSLVGLLGPKIDSKVIEWMKLYHALHARSLARWLHCMAPREHCTCSQHIQGGAATAPVTAGASTAQARPEEPKP